MDNLREIIEGLIDTEAVRFDLQFDDGIKKNFLRLWSTRELLDDPTRDALILRWRDSLSILRELLSGQFDFSRVDGLAVCQSDWGFDAHDLTWSEGRGHYHGNYRW